MTVNVPQAAESISEGEVAEWLKGTGDMLSPSLLT